jgi:hypothetical protein
MIVDDVESVQKHGDRRLIFPMMCKHNNNNNNRNKNEFEGYFGWNAI